MPVHATAKCRVHDTSWLLIKSVVTPFHTEMPGTGMKELVEHAEARQARIRTTPKSQPQSCSLFEELDCSIIPIGPNRGCEPRIAT